ncbi:Lsr2 family protein [Brachybacterium sp. P6-10-X1]|uniref:histone-like nucleoid-structuring protein Lsr2 n=1 Tax=Brachybacterium sp. P6-10-X1 TaxID=1903186 RepID=UPI0009757507|nr:Lsr2 family protein [Brachybacterium sp. P6-10-X1]
MDRFPLHTPPRRRRTSTVTIALDGVRYEIDLNDENASELRSKFSKWTSPARRVGGRAKRGTGKRNETKLIRDWAVHNGYDVSDRGLTPATVREAYEKAI